MREIILVEQSPQFVSRLRRFRLYARPVPLRNGLPSLPAKRSKTRKKILGVRATCSDFRVIAAKTLGNELPYYFFLSSGSISANAENGDSVPTSDYDSVAL